MVVHAFNSSIGGVKQHVPGQPGLTNHVLKITEKKESRHFTEQDSYVLTQELNKSRSRQLDVMVHSFRSSAWDAEVGESLSLRPG